MEIRMQSKKSMFWAAAAAGAISAMVFILSGLLFRLILGTATIAELAGDRIAPLLGIPLFFKMLGWLHGYSHLKQSGYLSVLIAEVVAFVIVSVVLSRFDRRRAKLLHIRTASVALLAWAVCVGFLWPNLGTNYSGLPPASATVANVAALAVEFLLAAWYLTWSLETWASAAEQPSGGTARRRLLVQGSSLLAAAAIVGILTRLFRIATYSYDGKENTGEDLPPVTPNDKFYSVTKNNVDPRPTPSLWGLQIDGKVARPTTLSLGAITALPAVEREVTLQCISNSIGGGLNSNAIWKGVPLKDLLQHAGALPTATQVTFHGADGFTDDIPFSKAMDPATLLVYQMNGTPLPLHHGFPVRALVPGYVGEKSVKWITRIEVLDHPEKGFYEQQGWGPKFTINNTSRFDAPDFDDPINLGESVCLKGTAFAGDRGVKRVEVSTDGEKTWRDAMITYKGSATAWVQWQMLWKPAAAGDYMLAVRCVDGNGKVQMGDMKGPAPEPATGYHRVKATVKA